MSIYEKTQITIDDKIIEDFKKSNPYIVRVKFEVPALGTQHEMIVRPRNYDEYSKSIFSLLNSNNNNEKIDPLLVGAKLTLQNQIVYPELEDKDFDPENNPADFIYTLSAKYQEIWDPVFTDIKYYNSSYDPEESKDFFNKYDKKLEEIKKEHSFAYGLKFENQFGIKSFFIINKLSNSEKLKLLTMQKDYQNNAFQTFFSKYSENIKSLVNLSMTPLGTIDPVKFEELRNERDLISDEDIVIDILSTIAKYNDDIYFNIAEYNHEPIRKFLESKVYYSYPEPIEHVVPNIMFYIYNDITASFDITKSIDLEKARNIIADFAKKHNIENEEVLHQLIRKVGKLLNE